jgi:hypothetical protein
MVVVIVIDLVLVLVLVFLVLLLSGSVITFWFKLLSSSSAAAAAAAAAFPYPNYEGFVVGGGVEPRGRAHRARIEIDTFTHRHIIKRERHTQEGCDMLFTTSTCTRRLPGGSLKMKWRHQMMFI